jgi:hypothetical protein
MNRRVFEVTLVLEVDLDKHRDPGEWDWPRVIDCYPADVLSQKSVEVDADELTFDEVEALGLDGSGRDGDPRHPYRESALTEQEKTRLAAYREAGMDSDGFRSLVQDEVDAALGKVRDEIEDEIEDVR